MQLDLEWKQSLKNHTAKLIKFTQTEMEQNNNNNIYLINPSGKLKLSFRLQNEKHIISVILSHEPYAHTHT